MTAASRKPTAKVTQSSGLVMTCLQRMPTPTAGSSEPTVKRVFIARPSMGRYSFMRSTIVGPAMQMTTVGMKENRMWETQGSTVSTRGMVFLMLSHFPPSTAFQPMPCHTRFRVAVP